MTKSQTAIRVLLTSLGVALFATLVGFSLPSSANAAETNVLTAQLLPPGGNSCTALNVSGFTPYVYDNALHGFEFRIDDASYVAIAATVGTTEIPFPQLLRLNDASGGLRIHAAIETVPIREATTIRITMLSARGDQHPTCISIMTAAVAPEGGVAAAPSAPAQSSKPATPTPPPTTTETREETPEDTDTSTEIRPTSTGRSTSAPVATGGAEAAVTASLQNTITDMCASGGAPRMWFVLLALYAIIVAAVVLGQEYLPRMIRTQEWAAALIVVPFLVLFAIWYFAESCRVSAWVPLIATLIALAGLASAFSKRSSEAESKSQTVVINLPPAGPKKPE